MSKPTFGECRKAIKPFDGVVSRVFVYAVTPYVVWAAARLRVTPNAISTVSIALYVLGAWYAWEQSYGLAALWTGVAFVFDCVDGQLARVTGKTSAFGAWYDMFTDRITDGLLFAAIGFGAFADVGIEGPALALGAFAALALRGFERMIREKLGVAEDISKAKGGWPSAKEQVKKSVMLTLLFDNSTRMGLLVLTLAIGEPILGLWIYVVWGGSVLLLKAANGAMMLRRADKKAA